MASTTNGEVSNMASVSNNTGTRTFKPASKPKGDLLAELQHNLSQLSGGDLKAAIQKLNKELGV